MNFHRPSTGFAMVKLYLLNINNFQSSLRLSQSVSPWSLNGFMVVKTCNTIHYRRSMGNTVIKTGLLNIYRLSTGITLVKTGMTTLYRLSTILPVVKMCLGSMYRLLLCFAAVKTGLPNSYWTSTRFGVVKTNCPTSYFNWLAKPLQGFNKFSICQNEPTIASTGFAAVKTDLPNF